ncbi:MAG: protein translocase subunit SecD [Phycisphaerales bacterium]|nr:protein translocase subunit SecD [Phycisphaerales bacterium]
MIHHLYRNTILVVLLLLLAATVIYPPKENLRLGKDLAGGVSLTYTIYLDRADTDDTVDQMIEVLKKRVNPQGLYEISFVREGRDRMVVTMPLPTEEVRTLKDALDTELERLDDYSLDVAAIERAMRLAGPERRIALEALMDTPGRKAMLEPVVEAAERAEKARTDYNMAVAAQQFADTDEVNRLEAEAASAVRALTEARKAALARSVTPQRVRAMFQLSPEAARIKEKGSLVELPSPRQRAFDGLRENLGALPGGAETLDSILKAHDAYAARARGLDDPNDLQRLLRGAGVLEFRIAVRPGAMSDEENLRTQLKQRGPEGVESNSAKWFPINKLEDWYESLEQLQALQDNPSGVFAGQGFVGEEYDGWYYLLLSDQPGLRLTPAEGDWRLTRAGQGTDELGRPSITFELDARGAVLMGKMTEANIDQPMAILLDGRIYSRPPNINSRIAGNGQIMGNFSPLEIAYVKQTLAAGALSAKLSESPISVENIAPDLGADNLRKGLEAGWISLIAVGAFMVFWYFSNGVVSLIALACNALILLAVMSLARTAFTLPGIAGVVLTFGMAVDSNVLIYERIREELLAGNDLKTSVRVAFQKVFSTIVDANITNLIVCVVLAYTATEEVKGFAITLGVGVVSTMFSALVITRLIYVWLVDRWGLIKMRQLPLAVPALNNLLEPKIDWIKLRPLFLVLSAAGVGLGIFMIYHQGEKMLDTEFRGGTAITLQLKRDPATGERITRTREQIEQTVKGDADSIYQKVVAVDPESPLRDIRNADIVVVDPESDGVTSDRFDIRTTVGQTPEEQKELLDLVTVAFEDVLDSRPALSFLGAESPSIDGAPVFKIITGTLGENIGQPAVANEVGEYVGGVVVLLEGINPPPTEDGLRERLSYMREQSDFAEFALKRSWDVIVLEGTRNAVTTAAIVVKDPAISMYDEDTWRTRLASTEWNIARSALTQATTLAGVQQFSAEVAKSFQAKAIVAMLLSFLLILIYVWVRFGSVRYSFAAIIALVHDVTIAVGLIAVAEVLYEHFPFLRTIGIRPFKIDLALVAALLTIVGYSLNDTIVILDRVREERGKLPYATKDVINRAISMTISRTTITSGTTLVAVIVLFFLGGDALASFTYALMCGIVVGTYSSIAVAAPLVYTKKIPAPAARYPSYGDRERRPVALEEPSTT